MDGQFGQFLEYEKSYFFDAGAGTEIFMFILVMPRSQEPFGSAISVGPEGRIFSYLNPIMLNFLNRNNQVQRVLMTFFHQE
jgi:hypothetical protein